MITGSMMIGSAVVGLIVQTAGTPAQPAPVTLNVIVSRTPALALESRIACRSDPAPLSAVVVTVRVAATAPGIKGANRRAEAANRLRP